MKYKLDFYTEYNQFYIGDQGSKGNTNSTNFWNPIAYSAKLALGEKILGIGIQSYGHVKGEIDVLIAPNFLVDYDLYDHIVEAGIESTSGTLEIINCPYSTVELSFKIKPGIYKVRIYSLNLSGVDIDESEGQDYYKIEIWPDTNMARKILKQYTCC